MSSRPFWRPELVSVSSVNSKTSHSAPKERARAKIRIAARSGFVLIREVLWRTWMMDSAVKPMARDAVNVIMRLHHQRP